jgi:hypothetical protein
MQLWMNLKVKQVEKKKKRADDEKMRRASEKPAVTCQIRQPIGAASEQNGPIRALLCQPSKYKEFSSDSDGESDCSSASANFRRFSHSAGLHQVRFFAFCGDFPQ